MSATHMQTLIDAIQKAEEAIMLNNGGEPTLEYTMVEQLTADVLFYRRRHRMPEDWTGKYVSWMGSFIGFNDDESLVVTPTSSTIEELLEWVSDNIPHTKEGPAGEIEKFLNTYSGPREHSVTQAIVALSKAFPGKDVIKGADREVIYVIGADEIADMVTATHQVVHVLASAGFRSDSESGLLKAFV